MGEVSETFLCFDGISPVVSRFLSPSSIFHARNGPYSTLLVRIFVFTCTSGSVIFDNIWDFAVYVWTIELNALSLP